MRTHVVFLSSAILFALANVGYSSHAQSKNPSELPIGDPSGIVTGLIGQATGVTPGASRELRIGDRVAVGEDVLLAAGTLEILWERRALFSLEGRTRIAMREAKNGLALLEIQEGAVQVAYSYNEGHPTDTLTVRTPATRTVLRGGIIQAKVERVGAQNPMQMSKPGQLAGTADELLRMIEGQAQVEPLNAGAKPFLLKVGYEFQISSGGSDAVRPAGASGARKLAAVSSHEHVPAPTIQRLVRIHVDHALEIEQALNKPSRDGNEAEGSVGGLNGAIVATSLGIPLTAISGTGGSVAASSSVPTFSPGPAVAGGIAPTAAPPAPVPIIQTPVQTPGVTVLTPSQSGGINSQSLLRDVLQDVVGKGHGKGGKN
jgi:hypothetical protein